MIYLLNPLILTVYGDFRFPGPIGLETARQRLTPGFVTAIGHGAAAGFLSALLALSVPVNRIAVAMAPGDTAQVLRLRERLPEGKVLDAQELAATPYELGWLERLA
jgi:hypothetical protein